ncbi:alpha/beta hydrolase [Blastococcus sp. SYSU D00820]
MTTVADRLPGVVDAEVAAALAQWPRDLSGLNEADLPTVRVAAPVPPAAPGVVRSRHVVPGDPDVVLHVHAPAQPRPGRACLYWMHGGGYVMGNAQANAADLDRWCALLDCVAVSVEYRLAPEHPYPAPLDDCLAGLSWVVASAAELGVDPGRIGIGGSSAGAGLAAGLALRARDLGGPAIAFQYLLHPMLDDRLCTPSSMWEDAPVWPRSANRFGWGAYLAGRAGYPDVQPYAAAARAVDLRGLPPALVLVGSVDGFVDECVEYAGRLLHAGVPTDLHMYSGAPHGFSSLAPGSALARRAVRDSDEWLAPFLRRSPGEGQSGTG